MNVTAVDPVIDTEEQINLEHDESEYLVESLGPDYEGWFPLGEVSLLAGSSGAGKTTLFLQWLENIEQGNSILGHQAKPRSYKILVHDRSKKAFKRTTKRMKLSDGMKEHIIRLTPEQQSGNPSEVIDGILTEHGGGIRIVFIEGLDMWTPSGKTDFVAVAGFVDSIQRVAEQWNVAIVGTVGSPKQKPRDRYENARDSVFGSTALGRKVETIVFIQLQNPKDPNSLRDCQILTRQGKAELFTFGFEGGKMVDVDSTKAVPLRPVQKKTKLEEYLDALQRGDLLKWSPQTGLSKSTYYRSLEEAHGKDLVFKQDGEWYKS